MDIKQTLLDEVNRRGLSARRLSINTGIPLSTANGFDYGDGTLTVATADKIAAYLGFELRCRPGRTAKKKKKKKR